MIKRKLLLCGLFWAWVNVCQAQDDLMALMTDSVAETQHVLPAFKGTRVINGHSVQTLGKQNLDFLISHRFDRVNRGAYDFFGLDGALIRLGLEYGLTDDVTVGIGRSSYFKTYDAYAKYRFLKQTANNSMPVTAAAFFSVNARTQRLIAPQELSGTDRLTYTSQLLVARRFNEHLSVQLSPTYIYRVRPEMTTDEQGVFAFGIGGRYLLNKRISFNGEYFYVPSGQINAVYTNNISFGFDIDTGGHVFQLHFTNSYGMTERYFITETVDSWAEGDIHFGFNISRRFALGSKSGSSKKW